MLRLARAATRVVDALAIASFTGMFLCVLGQVVLRYVFDRPLVWSDELARYLFVWCAFLGWSSLNAVDREAGPSLHSQPPPRH